MPHEPPKKHHHHHHQHCTLDFVFDFAPRGLSSCFVFRANRSPAASCCWRPQFWVEAVGQAPLTVPLVPTVNIRFGLGPLVQIIPSTHLYRIWPLQLVRCFSTWLFGSGGTSFSKRSLANCIHPSVSSTQDTAPTPPDFESDKPTPIPYPRATLPQATSESTLNPIS